MTLSGFGGRALTMTVRDDQGRPTVPVPRVLAVELLALVRHHREVVGRLAGAARRNPDLTRLGVLEAELADALLGRPAGERR